VWPINQPKIPQITQILLAQIVCPSPNVWDFNEKRLYWAPLSVIKGIPGGQNGYEVGGLSGQNDEEMLML
jgi:hypothetical protein